MEYNILTGCDEYMARGNTKRTNWYTTSTLNSELCEYVDVYGARDSSLVAFFIKDKSNIKLIQNIGLKEPSIYSGEYEPLKNNCGIYFLTGTRKIKDVTYKTVYIGQASSREESKGLDRLSEHLLINRDGKPRDNYYDLWDSALYITDKDNTWSTAKIDTLEEIFIKTFKDYSTKDTKCLVLNGPKGHSGNITDQEYQLAVTLITELLSTNLFGFSLDTNQYTKSVDDAIADMLTQMGNSIKAEIKSEVKSELSQEQKDKLQWIEQVERYDKFKDIISSSRQYIITNGRMPSGDSLESITDVLTPLDIATDVVNLIPSEEIKKGIKVLSLYSKDGIFGIAFIHRCMTDKTTKLYQEIPDMRERLDYVIQNMLYCISNSLTAYLLTSKNIIDIIEKYIDEIYGTSKKIKDHNLNIPKALTVSHMREGIKAYKVLGLRSKILEQLNSKYNIWNNEKDEPHMKFDIVIGNPPYNNDLYIPFVELAYALASKYVCMITPAKWQGKVDTNSKDQPNKRMRDIMNKNASNIVFYKDSTEVFNIEEWGGVLFHIK